MKRRGIYILTNRIDGKQYVGKDTNLPYRANRHLSGDSHSYHLKSAINKYGKENFSVKIIDYPNISGQLLSIFEQSHIAELGSYHHGYNLTQGGEGMTGHKPSKETREKRSKSMTGKPKSEEHRLHLTREYRKKKRIFSEEAKKNLGRKDEQNGSFRKNLKKYEPKIIQQYLHGESIEDLMKIYSCSDKPIRRILRKNNIPIRSSGRSQRIRNDKKRGQLVLFQ